MRLLFSALLAFACSNALALEISPENPNAFIFVEQPEILQKFGYKGLCKKADKPYCKDLPYKKYVGKKGLLLSEQPFKISSKYTTFKVQLETKEVLYYNIYNLSGNPLDKFGEPVMRLSKFMQSQEKVGKPIIPGSSVTPVKYIPSSDSFKFSFANEPLRTKELNVVKSILSSQTSRENDEEIVRLLSDMTLEEDRFEGVVKISPSLYRFKDVENKRPRVKITLTKVKDSSDLHSWVTYSGDDWLFVNSYKIIAGEQMFESPKTEFRRDHRGGEVWEWSSSKVTPNDIPVLKSIVSDPEAAIRFYGRDYYKDYKFTFTERQAIGDVLKLTSYLK